MQWWQEIPHKTFMELLKYKMTNYYYSYSGIGSIERTQVMTYTYYCTNISDYTQDSPELRRGWFVNLAQRSGKGWINDNTVECLCLWCDGLSAHQPFLFSSNLYKTKVIYQYLPEEAHWRGLISDGTSPPRVSLAHSCYNQRLSPQYLCLAARWLPSHTDGAEEQDLDRNSRLAEVQNTNNSTVHSGLGCSKSEYLYPVDKSLSRG